MGGLYDEMSGISLIPCRRQAGRASAREQHHLQALLLACRQVREIETACQGIANNLIVLDS